MSYTKTIGFQVTLGIDYTGGSTYVVQGVIVDKIGGQNAKTDMGDTTLLSDVFKTFLPASTDPGSLSFEVGWDALETNASSGGTYGKLAHAQKTGQVLGCQITGMSGSVETFQAYVESVGREFSKNKLNVVPVTLKLTGDPGFAAE